MAAASPAPKGEGKGIGASGGTEAATQKSQPPVDAELPELLYGRRIEGTGNDPHANLKIAGFTKGSEVVLDAATFGGALLFHCKKVKVPKGQNIGKLTDFSEIPHMDRTVVITRDRILVVDCVAGIGDPGTIKSSHHLVSRLCPLCARRLTPCRLLFSYNCLC